MAPGHFNGKNFGGLHTVNLSATCLGTNLGEARHSHYL